MADATDFMWAILVTMVCFGGVGLHAAEPGTSVAKLPQSLQAGWSDPPAELRPLQIVHGVPANRANVDAMKAMRRAGLGGIVCNVDFTEYMRSEKRWNTLVQAVTAAEEAGLVIWIYDEDGYPSASAGGLVLEGNPKYEAQALVYDPSRDEPFFVRPAYEYTHASNNFYAARRYPNLLDRAAMQSFIAKTHEAYRKRLGLRIGKSIRAFFTDEPSLLVVDLGKLPEHVRKKVRVVDPVDEENVKPLPGVPWCADLPKRYRERYDQDLLAVRKSLFVGDAKQDRVVRRRFWALVADLVAERYFGQIQHWCGKHGVASSGHMLWEEQILHHVPLYGNMLECLTRMDIPGLDMLNSDPSVPLHSGWLTAALPASAAILSGGRQVMTEVSDFSQRMAGKGPVPLDWMQATSAWQAAFGVTEFASYYGSMTQIVTSVETGTSKGGGRKYRAWCDYTGRLNALLRDAKLAPDVLLYYPIRDLWAEYRPIAQRLTLESQSTRAQQIVRSFLGLGRALTAAQVSFALVDHEHLGRAKPEGNHLALAGHRFIAIVFPAGVELPPDLDKVVQRFAKSGGILLRDGHPPAGEIANRLNASCALGRLEPASKRIVLGRFRRDGRDVLLALNTADKLYQGRVSLGGGARSWLLADPATGEIREETTDDHGKVELSLKGRAAVLLIGPKMP